VLRVVFDANVFVSAYIQPEGTPGQIVKRFLLLNVLFEPILTTGIVDEVIAALSYPKVQKAARSDVEPELWFEDLVVLAQLVAGDVDVPRLSSDPDDDKYIAAAVDGRAAFVVTGDPDLVDLGEYEGVRIVTPRTFLDVLER
jgi:putative PIN family toxin of toxin-antitoxin system